MRFICALGLVVCAGALWAQSGEEPEVARAKAALEHLRALVETGAAPRTQLEKAEAELADAQDAAFLRHTLYGPDLTDEQCDAMIAAAQRRWDRRKNELEKAEELVKQGVASRLSLGTFLEGLDRSRKEYDLAVSRARLTHELTLMAQAEQAQLEQAAAPAAEPGRYDGENILNSGEFARIAAAFERQFLRPLPVSAIGETAMHRALGFNHANRVDVALHPDTPEGAWLLRYLAARGIPCFAFRHAVPGRATAAHIHIGPMSTRILRGG